MNTAQTNKLQLPIHFMNTEIHAYDHLKKLTLNILMIPYEKIHFPYEYLIYKHISKSTLCWVHL
jgi:hypothetical protein